MNRGIFLILISIVIGVAAWYAWFFVIQLQKPATIPAALPKLAADLYPVYQGADWSLPTAEGFVIGTTSYGGASITSAPISVGMDPSSVITPFENYYDAKLKSLGWRVANDLAAGGHVGGQTGYRRGGDVILVRFGIGYENKPADAPSECPCTVTLSLFSTER